MIRRLLALGVGNLVDVLKMPADFAFWLLDQSPQKTAKASNQDSATPEWKVNRDGSKTMRVTNLEQLFAVLPRNPNLPKDESNAG